MKTAGPVGRCRHSPDEVDRVVAFNTRSRVTAAIAVASRASARPVRSGPGRAGPGDLPAPARGAAPHPAELADRTAAARHRRRGGRRGAGALRRGRHHRRPGLRRAWVTSRHHGKGLARRALAVELRRKGVDDEAVGEALDDLDPDDRGGHRPGPGRPQAAHRPGRYAGRGVPPAGRDAGPQGVLARPGGPGGQGGAGRTRGGHRRHGHRASTTWALDLDPLEADAAAAEYAGGDSADQRLTELRQTRELKLGGLITDHWLRSRSRVACRKSACAQVIDDTWNAQVGAGGRDRKDRRSAMRRSPAKDHVALTERTARA